MNYLSTTDKSAKSKQSAPCKSFRESSGFVLRQKYGNIIYHMRAYLQFDHRYKQCNTTQGRFSIVFNLSGCFGVRLHNLEL